MECFKFSLLLYSFLLFNSIISLIVVSLVFDFCFFNNFKTLPCLALPCPALPRPASPCLAQPCLAMPSLYFVLTSWNEVTINLPNLPFLAGRQSPIPSNLPAISKASFKAEAGNSSSPNKLKLNFQFLNIGR